MYCNIMDACIWNGCSWDWWILFIGWKYNNGGHKTICINNSSLLWDHILEATYKGGHLKAHANEWG